jgi:hypothetical protein
MAEMILNRIADPSLPQQIVTMPTELIKRDSCRLQVPFQDVASHGVPAHLTKV